MVSNPNLNREVAPSKSEVKRKDQAESSQDSSPDFKVDSTAAATILEAVDGGAEGGAEGMGNISEKVGESIGENRHGTAGRFQQFQQQMSDEEAEELKDRLLKSPPTTRQMIQQIQVHINKEIHLLEKKAGVLERDGNFKELNDLVTRMRELSTLLARLFYATADVIKNTWLKVVHGIV